MRNWKKLLVASLACSALFSTSPATVDAAYELNPEVKTATPALLNAAQIGVLKYESEDPALQNLANKDAIVVMSFGTTYKDTREKTIDATVAAIQKAHPDVDIFCAGMDSHLNENGYIVPGLGDAGDRIFGTK